MTEKQIAALKEEVQGNSLQVEQLSEDVRALMHTVQFQSDTIQVQSDTIQGLVSVIEEAGISSMSSKLHRLKKVAI